jgi:hypothetical protein
VKKCSASLAIKEMQIKMMLRSHVIFTPVRMTIKKNNNRCWWRCRGERNLRALICCWYKCKLVQPLWKEVWTFLKKLKNRATTWSYDSIYNIYTYMYTHNIPDTLGIYLKEVKWEFNRNTCTPMLVAALFTIAKLWNQPGCLQLMIG